MLDLSESPVDLTRRGDVAADGQEQVGAGGPFQLLGRCCTPRDGDPVTVRLEAPGTGQADPSRPARDQDHPPCAGVARQGPVPSFCHAGSPVAGSGGSGAPPHRTTALAHVIPAPNPENKMRSPSLSRPASAASERAIPQEAAEVLPV